MKMKTKVFLAIGIVLILVFAGLGGCSTVGAEGQATGSQPINVNMNSQQTGIWVSGEGKVTVVPDIATISLGVSSKEATVAEAQPKAADAMNKVVSALTANGVAEKDIQTSNYSIEQVIKWDDKTQEQIVTGYRVTNMVIAKIRSVDKVGTIIDAVAAAGGDFTRINGIAFSVDKPEEKYNEARALAIKDAQTKAQNLADLAGVKLGKATYISENTYTPIYAPQVYRDSVAGGMATTTPISAGETDITLNVQVAYSIQ